MFDTFQELYAHLVQVYGNNPQKLRDIIKSLVEADKETKKFILKF